MKLNWSNESIYFPNYTFRSKLDWDIFAAAKGDFQVWLAWIEQNRNWWRHIEIGKEKNWNRWRRRRFRRKEADKPKHIYAHIHARAQRANWASRSALQCFLEAINLPLKVVISHGAAANHCVMNVTFKKIKSKKVASIC